VIHDTIAVPKALKSAQKEVTLCIDTFFVNRMPFLHTISDRIHYRTSMWVPDRESSTYRTYLEVVFKVYWKAGFKIKYVCADQDFKFIPNIAAAQEHIPVVKRSIRVVNERRWATFHGNPFRSLPRILMKSVVQEYTRKLNFFPVRGGISDVYSPRTILHEVNLSFEQCRVPQLSYVLAHDEPNPTNSTQARAIDGIYMRTLSSAQGGHEVFNVSTGEVIQQRNVTVVPITDEVIKAVEAWAKKDSMEAFKIENKHGIILYDSMIAGVGEDDQDQENQENQEEEEAEEAQEEESQEEAAQEEEQTGEEEDVTGEEMLQGTVEPKVRRSTRVPMKRKVMNIARKDTKTYDVQMSQTGMVEMEYDLQGAKMFVMLITYLQDKMVVKRQEVHSQHVITYSLKRGVNKFGSRAEAAAMKEMQQMIDRECFDPIHRNELNDVERRRAMESLIFLSEKKDGSIKAQHCANGSTQMSYMEREEVSSPTVSTESTMLTSVIEAAEGRDVATCNIPNAFRQKLKRPTRAETGSS
jgi:hypothetical protein